MKNTSGDESPHSTEPAAGPVAGAVREADRRSVAVVTTTIHVPEIFSDLLANADRYGHADRLSVVVVGDRKTPAEVGRFLSELRRQYPAEITYLDVPAQRTLLRRWPALDLFVRYDCIQRRNVGYLQAALDGAEVIITVDDDNGVTEDDFIGHHLIAGTETELPVVRHASGWWNACERLECDPPRRFYHRGYPKSRQDWSAGGESVAREHARVVANGGLWLETPDVDATAHIEEPIRVVGLRPVLAERACALGTGTWCPLNSQNTAFDAVALPALYLPVMHDQVRGYRLARMDDIWMSYFLRAIADARGELIAYGPPLVIQERNPHNLVRDLSEELAGYLLTERLIDYLRAFRTTSATYSAAYLELIYHLRESVESDAGLDVADRECLRQLTLGMAAWHAAISDIRGERGLAGSP